TDESRSHHQPFERKRHSNYYGTNRRPGCRCRAGNGGPSRCHSNSLRCGPPRRPHLPARPHLQAHLAQLLRRHHFQGHYHSGNQWPAHVPNLVSDDRAAEERQARSASRDHRPHPHERLFQGNGAAEDRRVEQDPGVSERDEIGMVEGSEGYCATELAGNRIGGAGGRMGKSWIEVFDNWQSFLRFCLALLFVVIGVPLATWLAALALENALLHRSSVELTGGAIIFRGLENDKCVVPIPSNEPWTDTHCKLKKNKKVHIEVSGYINLGIHRLVKAAEEGELRETGWVTADGHPHDQGPQACLYENRTKLNIDPDLPVGAVIGFVQ